MLTQIHTSIQDNDGSLLTLDVGHAPIILYKRTPPTGGVKLGAAQINYTPQGFATYRAVDANIFIADFYSYYLKITYGEEGANIFLHTT